MSWICEFVTWSFLLVWTGLLGAAEPVARGTIPKDFRPTDTSRLMGSPDPLPLEAVRAFPNLSFRRPVELTSPHDGSRRNFVLEQPGRILVFDDNEEAADSAVFLDLTDVVRSTGNEEGLLGLAFHPDYRTNGEFFVYYSTTPRASVVSRFRVRKDDPNRADRDSEEQILVVPQPYENHNGGSIRFGRDGFLYIGFGDGGLRDDPHSNAQNLGALLGKILRIDVDRKEGDRAYAIPADNPFVKTPGARGEIWAYGFRNPWRIAFDRETDELWTGDVGQDRFEEIDLVRRGGNYGWNIREGFHGFEPSDPEKPVDLVEPLVEYFRGEGQSVTGGVPYRGTELKDHAGDYFYADYLTGKVWTIRRDGQRVVANPQVAETHLQIAAFGETSAGEMILCTFDGGLYRLKPRTSEDDSSKFPRKLSETGLFRNVEKNESAESLIPYELNIPFWSDYAVKERFVALPKEGAVTFHEREKWEFPVGTVLVKTFWMHQDRVRMERPRRLETRLLVHAPNGWAGYTYVYDDEGKEATLLGDGMVRPIEVETADGKVSQPYYFPSRDDCMTCHTKAEGFVLGLNTRQMNRTLQCGDAAANQIEMWSKLGAFQEPPMQEVKKLDAFPDWGFGNWDRSGRHPSGSAPKSPPKGEPEVLARAWLEVNCVACHQPNGIAAGNRDFRFQTPLNKVNVVDQRPGQKRRLPTSWRLVKPGHPEESDLFWRISLRGERQMPPLATRVSDEHALQIVKEWIEHLPTSDMPTSGGQ